MFYAAIQRAMSSITVFFSGFVYTVVFEQYNNKLHLALVILEVMLLWSGVDPYLRRMQTRLDGETGARWSQVVFSTLDFVAMLGLYLLVQLSLGILQKAWRQGVPDFVETGFGIMVASMIGFTVLQKIKEVEDDEATVLRALRASPTAMLPIGRRQPRGPRGISGKITAHPFVDDDDPDPGDDPTLLDGSGDDDGGSSLSQKKSK